MMEEEKFSIVIKKTKETVNIMAQSKTIEETAKKISNNKTNVVISIIMIIAGVAFYNLMKSQITNQSKITNTIDNQIDIPQQTQRIQKSKFYDIVKQEEKTIVDINAKQHALIKQPNPFQEKIIATSGIDTKTWLLLQVDHLVKLARYKLENNQDIITAFSLLKSANISLEGMRDPNFINVRRIITKDIASLDASLQYNNIILKLHQLSSQINKLHLTKNEDLLNNNKRLSNSISEWRINLKKSWQNFVNSLISIRRRSQTIVPLLAINRDICLRESIRFQLIIAEQAMLFFHKEIYKQSLDNVSTWIQVCYDTRDASTMAFIKEVEKLRQQNIVMSIPNRLESESVIEKLIQNNAYKLLAKPKEIMAVTRQEK